MDRGTLDVQGSIFLKVQFLHTGKVGDVTMVKGLHTKLNELAIAAANKIKFEPAVENGSPVDTTSVVRYSFRTPDGWLTKMPDPQADTVIANAIKFMGGDKYLGVKTLVGKGRFSVIREGRVISYQEFTDVIAFPDKERTDFKGQGIKTVQTNVGDTGWMFDGDHDRLIDQTETQISNFQRGIRVSLDNLLRGGWKGHAKLTYIGKRPATLGKRNDAVKLTYDDGFYVEFEFSADNGMPRKAIYKSGEETTESDLYEQFISVGGIKTPFVIDRRTNDEHTSRINYDSVKFNVQIPDSTFDKPADVKHLKSLKW